MKEQLAQEILSRLDALAAKLGTTAEHLWQVLIYEARVEAIVNSFSAIVLLALTIIFVKTALRLQGKYAKNQYDGYIPGIICSWIGAILGGALAFLLAASIPTLLLNPEYWALNQILQTLK